MTKTNQANIVMKPLGGGWLVARNNGGGKAAEVFYFLESERKSGRTQVVSGELSGPGIRYPALVEFIARAEAKGLTVQVGEPGR